MPHDEIERVIAEAQATVTPRQRKIIKLLQTKKKKR